MEESNTTAPKGLRLRAEMLVALIAVLISFSTLAVYIYQSSLMKQQQKMSVWPYLSFGPSWGSDYLMINLTNKGIGPAIIKQSVFEVDGEALDGIQQIMSSLPDSLQTNYSYSSIHGGQVLMAGENLNILTVHDTRTIAYLLKLFKNEKIRLEICYASVYGDTWVSYGIRVEECVCGE